MGGRRIVGSVVDTRARILDGAAEALVRFGLAKTTVEDIASAAGVGRATVYRWFEGGRDDVLDALVARELDALADEVLARLESGADVATGVGEVLRWGGTAIRDHTLLQAALDTGPEELAVRLARFEHGLERAVVPTVARRLADAGDPSASEDATYLVAMMMSVLVNPGSWDLDDDHQLAELVGLLVRSTSDTAGPTR